MAFLEAQYVKLKSKTTHTLRNFSLWSLQPVAESRTETLQHLHHQQRTFAFNPNGPYVLKDFCLSGKLIKS